MAWVKLDDGWWTHPKVLQVEPIDRLLWITAMSWSSQHGTDGKVPRYALPLIAGLAGAPKPDEAAERLLTAGLLELDADGWLIHDYLDYQPSAAEVADLRAARADAGRKGGKRSGEVRSKREATGEASASAKTKQTHSKRAGPGDAPSRRLLAASGNEAASGGHIPPDQGRPGFGYRAHPEANEANGKQNRTPSRPVPIDDSLRSSSSSRSAPVDDDDDVSQAHKLVARELAASTPGVRNPKAYERQIIATGDRLEDLRAIKAAHPTRDPTWLADEHLGRPHPPDKCTNCRGLYHTAETCKLPPMEDT